MILAAVAVVGLALVLGALVAWRHPRTRYRAAVALYGLAARASGGVCLCQYCVAFAGRTSRREWRQRYREASRSLRSTAGGHR